MNSDDGVGLQYSLAYAVAEVKGVGSGRGAFPTQAKGHKTRLGLG